MRNNQPVINFVTTNASKFAVYQLFFKDLDIKLERINEELYEPQSLDPHQIIAAKLTQAKEKFPNKKVIVDDRSLFIPTLNDFPGPAVKLALHGLGADGFLKLMADKKDRTMKFTTAMGFFDGRHDHYFFYDKTGTMLKEKRGTNLHGWTEMLYIYAPAPTPTKSLAEYSDSEWQRYLILNDETIELQQKIASLLKKEQN